jgi:hypothetical protein
MKYLEIKLPKKINNYSIKQAAKYLKWQDGIVIGELTIIDMVNLISEITEIKKKDLMSLHKDDVITAYKKIIKDFDYIPKEPKSTVTINGIDYYFEKNLDSKSWTAGRFIDSTDVSMDIEENPQRLFALCYIEKDKKYGDVPPKERAEIFNKYFKANDFLDLVGFFLQKYKNIHIGFQILKTAEAKYHAQKAEKIMRRLG